jgi:hypothetical protein
MSAAHRLLAIALLALGLAGCASWQPPAQFDDAGVRERAVTASVEDVQVAAAVLSAEDSRRMFGADVNASGVQPVWIEVRNGTREPLWLLSPGTDPDYFSPLEVAWSMHKLLAADANARIDDHFHRLGFRSPVLAGETRKGVLFINPERHTRLLNIDLIQKDRLIPFTLFLNVPDDPAEAPSGAATAASAPAASETADPAALRAALERLPCCAVASGEATPLNAIFVGDLADIAAALVRRGYRRDASAGDAAHQVFGRSPNVVLRKQAQAGAPATQLRLWLVPLRFESRSVYLVQVSRPVGGRFAPRGAGDGVPHEDMDEARNLLVQDMMYSGGLAKLAFATGVGPQAPAPGARYATDGLRAVLFLATRPLSMADVEFLDWAPYLGLPAPASRTENTR